MQKWRFNWKKLHCILKWERKFFSALFSPSQCYEILISLSFIFWLKARVFATCPVFKCKNGNEILKKLHCISKWEREIFSALFSPWQCYEIISLSFILWQKARVFAICFSFKCKNGNLIDKNCTASQNESGNFFLLFSLRDNVMKYSFL